MQKSGIHTAVDTAGNVCWEYFERILKYTDLFLYDIKLADSDRHLYYTGTENKMILKNLKKLFKANAKVWIRIPVVPGVNDSVEEAKKIKNFLKEYRPQKIELLPYHKLGEHKYDALDMKKYNFDAPDQRNIERLKLVFAVCQTIT